MCNNLVRMNVMKCVCGVIVLSKVTKANVCVDCDLRLYSTSLSFQGLMPKQKLMGVCTGTPHFSSVP